MFLLHLLVMTSTLLCLSSSNKSSHWLEYFVHSSQMLVEKMARVNFQKIMISFVLLWIPMSIFSGAILILVFWRSFLLVFLNFHDVFTFPFLLCFIFRIHDLLRFFVQISWSVNQVLILGKGKHISMRHNASCYAGLSVEEITIKILSVHNFYK